jgi:hypothetical protein
MNDGTGSDELTDRDGVDNKRSGLNASPCLAYRYRVKLHASEAQHVCLLSADRKPLYRLVRRGERANREIKRRLRELDDHLRTFIQDRDYSKRNYDQPRITDAVHKGMQMLEALGERLAR